MFEDTALLSKLYLDANVVLTDELTARYRQHPGSACAAALESGAYDWANPSTARRGFMEWLEGYLDARGVDDGRLRAAVARELSHYRPAWKLPVKRALSAAAGRARATLPAPALAAARRARGAVSGVGVGQVRFGSLRRVEPISRDFGFVRGLPVDRWYIEGFLEAHAADVRGRVLEIGDDTYTRRFGGAAVEVADVLHVHAGNELATFVGDLADGAGLPDDAFDCIVLTQTLHLVYDMAAAVRTLHRVLRPGGVVLATVPGISHVSGDEWRHGWFWAITPAGAGRLFGDEFGPDQVEVAGRGNVLAATAFLQGLSAAELRPEELAHDDPQYPLVVTVRAVRAEPRAPGADG
jgi:SAM-dependent methyltransferase